VYALTGGLAPLMPAIEASQLKKKTPPLEKVVSSFYFVLAMLNYFSDLIY